MTFNFCFTCLVFFFINGDIFKHCWDTLVNLWDLLSRIQRQCLFSIHIRQYYIIIILNRIDMTSKTYLVTNCQWNYKPYHTPVSLRLFCISDTWNSCISWKLYYVNLVMRVAPILHVYILLLLILYNNMS